MAQMRAQDALRFAWISALFALLSFPVVTRILFDYLNGGHGWRQGDWLINFGSGPVRRGIVGEALIALSDATGIGLLATVQLVQTGLFVALAFVAWLIALRHRNRALVLMLAASPGIFLVFWAGDVQGNMRKEVLGLLALGLLVLHSLPRARAHPPALPVLPALAVALYVVGCLGNIMHSFMLPIMLFALWLGHEAGRIGQGAVLWLGGIAAGASLGSFAFAAVFIDVPALAGMCERLTARGIDPKVCDEAMFWLVRGEVDHSAQLSAKGTLAGLSRWAAVAALALVPVARARRLAGTPGMVWLIAGLAFVPLLPLYGLATDWGRWISLSYTCFALLLLQAEATGRLPLRAAPSRALSLGLLALALVISHEHTIGWQPGGALRSVIVALQDIR